MTILDHRRPSSASYATETTGDVEGRVWAASSSVSHTAVAPPTARQLLGDFVADLNELVRAPGARPTTGAAAHRTAHFVASVLTDGAPTRQLSTDGEGGFEVRWIVDGWCVTATFAADFTSSVWIADPQGRQGPFFDGESRVAVPSRMVAACRDRLQVMGRDVRHRVRR